MVLFGLSKGKTFWLCSLYIGESITCLCTRVRRHRSYDEGAVSGCSCRYQKVLVPLTTHGYRPLTGKARLVGSTARRCRGGPMASVVNSPEDMAFLEKEDLSLPVDYRPSPAEDYTNRSEEHTA